MKVKSHGGPAFPFEYVNQTGSLQESFITDTMIKPSGAEQYSGMTMRDYFAAKAMQSLIIATKELVFSHRCLATESYKYADAMLKEHNNE